MANADIKQSTNEMPCFGKAGSLEGVIFLNSVRTIVNSPTADKNFLIGNI